MRKYHKLIAMFMVAIFLTTNVFAQFGTVFADTVKVKREKVEIIVKYKDENKLPAVQTTVKTKLKLGKLNLKGKIRNHKIGILEIASTDNISNAIAELKKDPNVEFAQPNYPLSIESETDPKFQEQWALANTGQAVAMQSGTAGMDINVQKAWALTKGTPSVVVGVLDTGIDINHNDLKDNIYINPNETANNGIDDDGNGYIDDVNGWDFANEDKSIYDAASEEKHGTHIAGIIAAKENEEGIKGVAPNVKIMPLKFISGSTGYTSDAIEAIEYAQKMGVKIINCSFGGVNANQALKDAMASSDILFVCSAGNVGQDNSLYPNYPASFDLPNVISIAAMDNQGQLASFSNYGSNVDVAAPGVGILSTQPENQYGNMSGTSMAAPFATGIAALIKSYIPDMTADQMAARIRMKVKPSTSFAGKVSSNGSVDAYAALTMAATADTPTTNTPTTKPSSKENDIISTQAVSISPQLLEQIHYGENGVNVATGNYSTNKTDMSMLSPGFTINISRTYNSKDTRTISIMGKGWTFGFEGSLKQDTVNTNLWIANLPNGSAQVFVKNADNSYTANDSRSLLAVDPADGLRTLTTKDQYKYKFNTLGYLCMMVDRNNNVTTIVVNHEGKVMSITDQVRRTFTVSYHEVYGFITKVTNPLGYEVRYDYDANARLQKVTDATGKSESYTYDANGLLNTICDSAGIVKETINYNNGKVSTYKDAYGNNFIYTYDNAAQTTIKDNNGATGCRTIVKGFDSSFYITSTKDPEGRTARVEYYLDANGKNVYGEEKSVTDRYGNKTIYTRDTSTGNITQVINPDGTTEEYKYDSKNNITAEKDAAGKWTFYVYDNNKINLLKKVKPLNGSDEYLETSDQSKFAITSYSYYDGDSINLLGAGDIGIFEIASAKSGVSLVNIANPVTGDNMRAIRLDKDASTPYIRTAQRSLKTNTSYVVEFDYWADADNVKFNCDFFPDDLPETLPVAQKVLNHYTWQVSSRSSNMSSMSLRFFNDRTTTNPANIYITNIKLYESTPYQTPCLANGLLRQEISPMGETVTYTYDQYGNVATVTDGENNTTKNAYNKIGWITSSISPKGYKTSYYYDKAGRVERTVLNNGESTRIVYDIEGRKKKEITPNLYNSAGERHINSELTQTYTEEVGDRYSYYTDAGFGYGKVKTETDPMNNVTTYTYDIYGNVISEAKPNGAIYFYYYDVMDRLTKTSYKSDANSAEVILEEYTYRVLTNGKYQKIESQSLSIADDKAITTYTYDFAGRLVEQINPDGGKITTTYNGDGTVNTITDAQGSTTYYRYDGLNRLVGTWSPTEPGLYKYTAIVYDKAGKKIEEKTSKGLVELHGVPSSDRYISTYYSYYKNGKIKAKSDSGKSKTVYEYDKDGNINRISEYVDENICNVTEFVNNHLGKPVQKKIHVKSGDLKGNDFEDDTDVILTTTMDYDKNGNLIKVVTPDGNILTYTYDKMDRKTEESQLGQNEMGYPVKITTSTTYDNMGNVKTQTDALGNITNYYYDTRSQLCMVSRAKIENGTSISVNTAYGYDWAGRKVVEVTPANYKEGVADLYQMNRTEYTYDKMGRMLTKKEIYLDTNVTPNATISFVSKACKYDLNGNLIKELDGEGFNVGLGTTDAEKIETGYGTEYRYNLANQVDTMLDPVSKDRGLTYTINYDYDGLGRKTSETNAKGAVTNYYYDDRGSVTSIAVKKTDGDAEQVIRKSTYDLSGKPITQTDGNGNTITYEYNAFGKVRKTTRPGDDSIPANTITCQYDVMGNLVKSVDSEGTTKLMTYDKQGRVLTQTEQDKDGKQAITNSVTYDKNGNKRFETDGNGNVKKYFYDYLNRLIEVDQDVTQLRIQGIKVEFKEGQIISHKTKYGYDKNSNQTTITDWRGNTFTNVYDPINRLIEKKDPYYTIQKLKYNFSHLQIESYDGKGKRTAFTYDKNNRQLSITDQLLHTTSQTYDNAGNVDTKTDGNGNVTHYDYDQFNRLVSVTNALNEVTGYTYDLNGNMLTQRDAKGNTTTMEYNVLGKPIRRIDHGGRKGSAGAYTYDNAKTETYTYDSDGNLLSRVDRNGVTTTYTYDCHGRMLSQKAGALSISYTYDNNGNQLSMTDSTGKTTRTYDEMNRVITKTVPKMGTSTFCYDQEWNNGDEYGLTGEITTDAKGNVTSKLYDKVGRLLVVKSEGEAIGTVYQYDANGNKTSVTFNSGAKEVYEYYDDNLLRKLTNFKTGTTPSETYDYTYDAAHNQTTKVDSKGTTTYQYDKLNRLNYVLEPGSLGGKLTQYTYDKAGNRLTEKVTSGTQVTTTTYSYNEQNRLMDTTVVTPANTREITKYVYDNNGNMLQKSKETIKQLDPAQPLPKASFGMFIPGQDMSKLRPEVQDIAKSMLVCEYDVFNQLTVTKGADISYYTYNGDGLRVEKKVNEGKASEKITRYLYEYDKVVLETDGKGKQTARNVYGTNLISRTMDGQKLYYMYNGHADVTSLIDAVGTEVAKYYYDAFGNPLETTGTVSNPIRYAGYQYDSETGLYYLNARYYDSKIARFLTEDTYRGQANDPLSLNLYTYCANEPVMYSDPTGHVRADADYGDKKPAPGKTVTTTIKTKTGTTTTTTTTSKKGVTTTSVVTTSKKTGVTATTTKTTTSKTGGTTTTMATTTTSKKGTTTTTTTTANTKSTGIVTTVKATTNTGVTTTKVTITTSVEQAKPTNVVTQQKTGEIIKPADSGYVLKADNSNVDNGRKSLIAFSDTDYPTTDAILNKRLDDFPDNSAVFVGTLKHEPFQAEADKEDGIKISVGGSGSVVELDQKPKSIGNDKINIGVGANLKVLTAEALAKYQLNTEEIGTKAGLNASAVKIEMPIEINIFKMNVTAKPGVTIYSAGAGYKFIVNPQKMRIETGCELDLGEGGVTFSGSIGKR